MLVNREHLCNTTALGTAKQLLSGRPAAAVGLPIQYIIQAVKAGWFIIPHWKNGQYSQQQFQKITNALQRHPGLEQARKNAEAAVCHAKREYGGQAFEIFGTSRARCFESPLEIVERAPYQCPRMPIAFVPGKFSAREYCDLLDDIEAKIKRAEKISEVFTSAGFFDSQACPFDKAEMLIRNGLQSMVSPLLRTVHKMSSIELSNSLLDDYIYGRINRSQLQAETRARIDAQRKAEHLHWTGIRLKVAKIAGVFSELSSYSQAALTKALRTKLNPRYGIKRLNTANGSRLVIEVNETAELGVSTSIESAFMLANWVIALDLALPRSISSYGEYLAGVEQANNVLDRLRREIAA